MADDLPHWNVTVGNGNRADGHRVFTVAAPDAIAAIVSARTAAVRTGWAPMYVYANVVELELIR